MSESVDRMLIQVERDLDRKQIERAKINLVSLIKKCTPENLDELFRALEILEEIERSEGIYFGKNAEKFAAYIRNLAVCKPDSWNMVDLFDARVTILRARSLAKNPDRSHEFAIEATGLVEDLMSASEIFQSEENWDEALQAEFCASVMKLRVAEIFGASMEFCFANLCEIVGFCKFCDSQIEYKIGYLTEKLDEVDEDFFYLESYNDEIDEQLDRFILQRENLEVLELQLRTVQSIVASLCGMREFAQMEAEVLLGDFDFDDSDGDRKIKRFLKNLSQNGGRLTSKKKRKQPRKPRRKNVIA